MSDHTIEAEIPVRVADKEKSATSDLLSQPRFWATLAHALSPIMFFFIFVGDGIFPLVFMGANLGIYLYWREKSPVVKRASEQALVAQLIGTFGWLALLLSGIAVWVVLFIISVILVIALIGIILAPLMLVALPLFVLATFALPLSAALFGVIGAWEAWNDREFRYPYLAKMMENGVGVDVVKVRSEQKAVEIV